ncbi:MAG: hypothetical protein GF308_00490 [Candidatus Heimdallarchaeota archaeon]|nr:hypothetical protein [Candidatus Heimdallarchaeota archaeon]
MSLVENVVNDNSLENAEVFSEIFNSFSIEALRLEATLEDEVTTYPIESSLPEMDYIPPEKDYLQNLSVSPQKKGITDYLALLANFIQKLLKKFEAIWTELISNLFDLFIKALFDISYKLQKRLLFKFQEIYVFFQFFGLKTISAKTFKRVSAALQWNVCDYNWISKEFLENYQNYSLKELDLETSNAIKQLVLTIEMMELDHKKKKMFEKELANALEEL